MTIPDYQGGSLVNLMSSLSAALSTQAHSYTPLTLLPATDIQASRHVVLLVIDGLGYEYLVNRANGSVMHQHLHGAMTSVFPSTTASAITTFMTGQAPQQHGMTGWFTWLRELGCVTAVLPFAPRARTGLFDANRIDPQQVYQHTPFFDSLDRTSWVVAPEWILHTDYNLAHSGSALRRGFDTMTECFSNISQIVKAASDPVYVYAYWPDFDRYSHESGNASNKVADHFAELDEQLHGLFNALNGTDTMVIVTADHGFIDTAPEQLINIKDHPEIQQSLLLPLCGEPRAAYCYLQAGQEERFTDYVQSHWSRQVELKSSVELIEAGYFGHGQPHPELAHRVGHYTLLMKENYVIKDQVIGEGPFQQIGVHGGVSDAEMQVPLIVRHC